MPSDATRRTRALLGLGVLQLGAYGVLALWPGVGARPPVIIALALTAFALYAAALGLGRDVSGRGTWMAAVLFGLAFRLLLIPEAPALSDDYFRYLWDGWVQARGMNPYRHAPADPALAGLGDALRLRVNHPTVPTIYPPLAQIAFLLVALVPGGLIPLKLLWLACDLGIAAALYRLLAGPDRLRAWLVYWWSPLVVIEVAWNAHLDLLGVLPLVLALVAAARLARAGPSGSAARGRGHTTSVALGLALAGSTLVKYLAAALLPAAVRAAGRGRRGLVIAAFVACVVLLYLPYLAAGPGLMEGLATYARVWRFNDGLFGILAWVTGSPTVARGVAGLAVAYLVVQSVRKRWSLEKAAFWIVGGILLLSPTVHPWYLLWMVPLLSLRPNRAWVYLSGSVLLAYYGLGTYRAEGVWPEPLALKLAIYGPFALLLLWDAWRGSGLQAARSSTKEVGL